MRRREFITLLGGAAATWPHGARAQQPTAHPGNGIFDSGSPRAVQRLAAAFAAGLQAEGCVHGRNIGIDYRWAEGRDGELSTHAADLVLRKLALIAPLGGPISAQAATQA